MEVHTFQLDQKKIVVFKAVSNKTLLHRLTESTPKSSTSEREIPIGAYLIWLLEQYRKTSPAPLSGQYVFPSPRYKHKRPIGETAVKRVIDDASKAAGLPQIDKHELRHSFATALNAMGGVDSETIMSLLGHSSKSITEKVYIHPDEARRLLAMNNLDTLLKDKKKD